MANDSNIAPYQFDKQTASEQREIARLGGIASGKARRERREARELVKIALDELVRDKKTGEEMPKRLAMIQKQIQKAINNADTTAFEKVFRLAGEWEQETNSNVTIVNNYNGISAEGADALNHIDEL